MTSNTTDPRPAATEAGGFPVERDWDIALKTLVDMATSDRSDTSAYLNLWSDITRRLIAAAPPSGQVCVDEEVAVWATRAMRMCRDSVTDPESELIWDTHYRAMKAAVDKGADR